LRYSKGKRRFSDAAIALLLPLFAFGNTPAVDPSIQVFLGQRPDNLAGEVDIFA
jgi:hypothetical protein